MLQIRLNILAIGLSMFSFADAFAQDKYAVVVGVEAYSGTFDPLDYANEDARELGKALESLGFTTIVMTSDAANSTHRPSTPEKIATIIKTVAGSCEPGDAMLVSLSGHGVQFSDESIGPSGTRETYFCPQDATLSNKVSLMKISSLMDFMNPVSYTHLTLPTKA